MKLFVKKIPVIVCVLIFLFYIGITVFLTLTSGNTAPISRANEGIVELDGDWFTEDGSVAGDIRKLNLLPMSSKTEEHSIYTVIPDNIPKGGALSFRVKHLFYSVYIGRENVYTLNTPESPFYTNSAGVSWVVIPLDPDDAGKTLELRYRLCYENSTCGIDSVKIEAGHERILDIIKEKFIAFFNSLIYLILSITLIIIDIPISKTLNKSHSFLYLGLVTFAIALFCITETQAMQLFIQNNRIIHLITCYSLMLEPMPVVLYANSVFPFKSRYTVHIFAFINLTIFLLTTMMNIFSRYDYHDTLTVVHADIMASITAMTVAIIKYIISEFKKKKKLDTYLFLEISGLAALMLTGSIDVYRYYFFNTNDPAKFVRLGILVFVVFFAVSNYEKVNTALVLNARNELIAKLAYQDGLTGLYNRMAYNEALEKLQKKHKYIGICGFDVNNLKKINDNIGHDMGDKLINESGRIISTAFNENESVCFRIGGDEFTVVLYGENIEERIKNSLDKMYSLCDEFNNAGNYPFRISIASGSSIYDGTGSIEETAKKADKLMYEHKKKMKEDPIETFNGVPVQP